MYEINLGKIARDKITNFEGTVVSVTTYLHGTDQATLQPIINKDGKMPDTQGFDVCQLEIINETKKVESPEFSKKLKHGQKVFDPISDYKGVILSIGYHLNGCRRIGISRSVNENKDKKLDDVQWFDEDQLSIVEKKPVQERQTSTGGPLKYPDNRRF